MALIGVCHSPSRGLTDMGGDHMKTMTRAHLFGGPERVRRANERMERARLLTASMRERAMELAQKYEGFPRNEAQRRRLAKLRHYRDRSFASSRSNLCRRRFSNTRRVPTSACCAASAAAVAWPLSFACLIASCWQAMRSLSALTC